jgi:hypothetical protein
MAKEQATTGDSRDDAGPSVQKPKPAIAIDLPPSAVSEAKPAESGAPDAATSSPDSDKIIAKKQRPALLVPSILALVAGAGGGFGAWHLTDQFNPRVPRANPAIEQRLAVLEQAPRTGAAAGEIPIAVMDRLARAEAAVVASTERESRLREEIAKLASGLEAETGERAKALAALVERNAGAPAAAQVVIPVPDANRDVDQLKSRLGSVESAANALPSAIGTVSAKVDSVATRVDSLPPRIDQMTLRVEGLAPKIEAASEQVATLQKIVAGLSNRDQLARASGLVSGTGLLSDALERGQPLGTAMSVLQNLGLGADELIAFSPFAEKGAPSAQALLAQLRAIKPPQANGSTSGDLMERMRSGLSSFIEVRRTGEVTGTDDPSRIAVAEQALARADIGSAIAAIGRLSPARAPAYFAWRTLAEQRQRAGEVATRLRQSAILALRDAAAGAAKP